MWRQGCICLSLDEKKQHDQHSRTRGVKLGDAVIVRNYSRGSKWVPGTIIQETGPLSVRVELEDGMVVRRHHDELISRTTQPLCPSPTAQRAGHSNEGSVVPEVAVSDVHSPNPNPNLWGVGATHYTRRPKLIPCHPGATISSKGQKTTTALLLMDPSCPHEDLISSRRDATYCLGT